VDAQPQPFRRPGRELTVDDAPQPRVTRRVRRDHHLVTAEVDAREVGDHDRRHRRVMVRVAPDVPYVVVPGDGPESGAVRLRMPVDGCVVSQPAELLVRLALGERRRVEQVDVHADGIANNAAILSIVSCSVGVTVLAAAATALAMSTNQPATCAASSFGSLRNAVAAPPRSASDASMTWSRFA